MSWLETKVPPLVVVVVVAALMWLAARYIPAAVFDLPFRQVLFVIITPAAALIAGFAIRSFRMAQTTVDPSDPTAADRLVTSGLFRISRNPMYVALTLLLLAFAIYLQNAVSFALVLLLPLYITRFQIRPEERALQEKFGEEYAAYCRSVRRWL